MKVLIAIDGSPSAANAMTAACRILSPEDRCIDLMCVVPEPADPSRPHKSGGPDKLHRRAVRILDAARQALSEQGVNARPVVEQGSAIKTLLRASLQYDVTVVGSKDRKNDSSAGLGPVANRIIEHSSASVLIGRETRNDSGLRILAPVDGSGAGLAAIEKLASLVDLAAAEVTLMHVVETPWLIGPEPPDAMGEEDDQDNPQAQLAYELDREAEEVIEAARNRLPPRTAVNRVIERGFPAEAILKEADSDDYDLVLIAASGPTDDMKHQLLGSTSVKVAWSAPCSVLLVRSA